jgi:hypothetical protein
LLGGVLDGLHRALQRFRREVGVQDDVIELATAQGQGLRAERDDGQPNVLVEIGVEEKDLIFPDRPVVVEDHLAVPQLAHDLREVLHLRGRHRGHPERVVHRRNIAADAQGEAAPGQPVHGGGPRSGDQRVPGVVIGCRRGDLHALGRRTGGADERGRFLDVPAFGDERGAEAEFLAAARLVHQRGRPLTAGTGQQVVAEFVQNWLTHAQTPCL